MNQTTDQRSIVCRSPLIPGDNPHNRIDKLRGGKIGTMVALPRGQLNQVKTKNFPAGNCPFQKDQGLVPGGSSGNRASRLPR